MLNPPAIRVAVPLMLLLVWELFGSAVANDDARCPAGCSCHPWTPRVRPIKIEANCSGLAFKALPAHFQHHIASLEASFNEIEMLSKDFFGEAKMKLSKINFSNNSIRTIDNKAFAVLPDLWIMNLTGNKLQYLHHDTFKANLRLWYLILRGNNIDINGHSILLNAPQIRKLDLSFNNIRELKENTFSQMPNIVYLRLHNNQFKRLRSSWFRSLSKLERLFLEHNQLTHLDVETFIHTPKLFELSLSWNKLVIPSHTPFLRLPNVEYLHLSGCDFGSLPAHMFELAPRVRMLWIASNKLSSLTVNLLNYLESLIFLNACDNQLLCTCDLKEVWEVCRYRRIAADVSCTFGASPVVSAGAAAPVDGGCSGRWDVLEGVACNASAHEAQLERLEDTSIVELATYVSIGVVLLLGVLVCISLSCWKWNNRRTRAIRIARNPAYPDMMPLNIDREESQVES